MDNISEDTVLFYDPELYAIEVGVSYGRDTRKRLYADIAEHVGGPVLELGCGTGDILLAIAQRGIRADGIDLSSRMVEACRGRIRTQGRQMESLIVVQEGDMRTCKYPGRYRAVFLPYHSFYHLLLPDDIVNTVKRIWDSLLPEGVIAFDVFQVATATWQPLPDGTLMKPSEPPSMTKWARKKALLYALERTVLQPINQRLVSTFYYSVLDDLGVVQESFTRRLHYRISTEVELREILSDGGFGDISVSPLTGIDSRDLVITARKKSQ